MEPKRLYRSITDRKFAGVSGGLAEYFEIDPLFIRLIFVVLTLAGGGGALIYIVLWIVTPEQPFTIQPAMNQPNTDFHQPDQPASEPLNEEPFSKTPPISAPPATKTIKRKRGSFIGGLVLITVGCLFLADEMIPQVNFGDLWPVILIVVGVGLLINTITKRNQNNNKF
ncbi:MAG: PspC domain-containing protein [Bacteroidetes bacterium]|nr:PspC domain-containing protein [Bacteroidota bacterium]